MEEAETIVKEPEVFIEVRKVLTDKDSKINTRIQVEFINVSLIKTFREWFKGPNDTLIEGDMTIVMIKDSDLSRTSTANKNNEFVEREKLRTMLIQESFDSFINRMKYKAVVKRLE